MVMLASTKAALWKNSEFGSIPYDWDVLEAFDFRPFITSGSRGWARYYSDFGRPFIRITNLSHEDIYPDLANLRLVDIASDNAEAKRTALRLGDVLISITADIGAIGYVDENVPLPAYINQHIACLRLPNQQIDSRYVAYFLASEPSQRRFRSMLDVGAKSGLNLTAIGSLKLLLPPLKEQHVIAEALSDADALIELLEALIAKKRAIKRGTMQDLLSGRKRLPGFRESWAKKPISQIAPLQRGFDLPNSHILSGRYPVIYSNGIGTTHNAFQVMGPGVVTGRSGTLGKIFYCEKEYWPHNTTLWVTNFRGNLPRFIFYLYQHLGFERFASGTGVPTLNRNDAHSFIIRFPENKSEQSGIAEILDDLENEIIALETRLNKARQIKQGMMQELLTGRVRLI